MGSARLSSVQQIYSTNITIPHNSEMFSTLLLHYINPLNPKGFCVFERFSAYTRPMGFRDSIFKVTMESAAALRH